jgi:hypothetical protein
MSFFELIREVERMTRPVKFLVLFMVLLTAGVSQSAELTLYPVLTGHDEREDGVTGCLHETAFRAGVATADLHLKVGGESAGCDAEWAASFEFDLSTAPPTEQIYSATLVVRKTGYSDDSQGFAYLGAFQYLATGSEVLVPRDDLDPQTALDIVYPSAANGDLSFDVTPAIQAFLANQAARAGLLLAGVYSEAGYEDWISVGGQGYTLPPRLIVEYQGTVDAPTTSWSSLKASFD